MKHIIIYTDGGSRGNPGSAGGGIVFCNEKGEAIKKYAEFFGTNLTNNEAEYEAVIFAMKKFKALFGKKLAESTEVELRSDSELLVKQLNGEYKVLEPKIQALFIQVWNLRLDFKKMKFRLISRNKNTEADKLANEALDTHSSNRQLI